MINNVHSVVEFQSLFVEIYQNKNSYTALGASEVRHKINYMFLYLVHNHRRLIRNKNKIVHNF